MEVILTVAGFAAGFLLAFFFLRSRLSAAEARASQAEMSHTLLQQQLQEKINGLQQQYQDKISGLQLQLQEKQADLLQTRDQWRKEFNQVLSLQTELTKTETDLYHLKQKLTDQKAEVETLRASFLQQFASVSNQVLVNNAEHFKKASAENLESILTPLKERIKEFEAKVDTTYEKNLRENVALKEQITMLANLNQQMSQDAINLTRALKGEKKTQGNWGEYLLEVLLEKSGLRKGEHYQREVVIKNDHQKVYRPDVIVNLPGNKHLIIDSKVSLVAYDAYCNCEDDAMAQAHLLSHIQSIRNHYQELSKKEYQHLPGLHTPDFVLMYIPIEPAFNLAMQHDRDLFIEALNHNIVFVTTSTLLATLRTVEGVWKQENQKNNVLRIARESGLLYDKFVGFVEDLKAIGRHLETSHNSYQSAMNKLTEGKGNLIKKVEQLRNLGARTTKSLDNKLVQEAEEDAAPAALPAPSSLLEE